MSNTTLKEYLKTIDEQKITRPAFVLRLSKQMIAEGKSKKNDELRAYGEYYYIDALFRLGKFSTVSLKSAATVLNLAKRCKLYELEARCYNMLGIHYATCGDVLSALENYQTAEKVATQHKNYSVLRAVYNNLGDLYLELKDYEEALKYNNKCLNSVKRLIDKNEIKGNDAEYIMVVSLINLTEVDYMLGKYEESLDKIAKVREKMTEEDPLMLKPSVEVFYALNYIGMGKREEADTHIRRAIDASIGHADYVECFRNYKLLLEKVVKEKYDDDYARAILGILRNFALTNGLVNLVCSYYEAAINYEKIRKSDNAKLFGLYTDYFNFKHNQEEEALDEKLRAVRSRNTLNGIMRRQEEIEIKNAKLAKMYEQDPLTGLFNRYILSSTCEEFCAKAREEKLQTGVTIIDIDYFKNYNDSYGHLEGDEVLKKVSEALKKAAVSDEILIRYGGDEFLVFFKNKTLDEVVNFSKRVNENLKGCAIKNDSSSVSEFLTVSQGIVNGYPETAESMMDFIHFADNALYKAKSEKRGCIGVYLGTDKYTVL
ncbi:MAG: GGDEF domain-containing protein [Lachnospiraceae bacterium]|nr:GGDEF domain-containing protein [Lachnospiraceae bacterium]